MKKTTLIFLLIIAFLASCRDRSSDVMREVRLNGATLTEINIDNIPAEVIEIKLSDLFTDFQIIPLETREECLIGGYNKVATLTANNIFVGFHEPDKPTVTLRFDLDGNFINSIGVGGRGPGEHRGHDVGEIIADDNKEIITIDWSGYVSDGPMIYKYDGTWLSGFFYPEDLLSGLYRWGDNEWFSTGSVTGIPEYPRDSILIIFYDNKGVKTRVHPRSVYPPGKSEKYTPYGPISVYTFNDQYKIFSPESDTVYRITKEKLIATEVLHRGTGQMPYNKFIDPQASVGKHDIELLAETNSYYLITKRIYTKADMREYQPGKWGGIVETENRIILIDKKSRKGSYIKLTDDIFGFLPDWFFDNIFFSFKDNTISYQIDAIRLLNSLTEKNIERQKPEPLTSSPERWNELTEESNPVLITFNLKEKVGFLK